MDSQVRNGHFKESNVMDSKKQKKKKDAVIVDKETESILQEAEIVARWSKKPFYIC